MCVSVFLQEAVSATVLQVFVAEDPVMKMTDEENDIINLEGFLSCSMSTVTEGKEKKLSCKIVKSQIFVFVEE